MIASQLPTDVSTKTIVRQEEDYNAAGLDARRTIPLPFTLAHVNAEEIAKLGFVPAGVVRGMNQNFVENVANIHGAQVRSAVKNGEPLPGEEAMQAILDKYDFSGVRASSEAGMPEEERMFRTQLKKQLRSLLRQGVFSADGKTTLTVQTQPEAAKDKLPAGKMALAEFDILVESAAEGVVFEHDGVSFDFGGNPSFDENGDFNNFAAITAFAHELAEKEMALARAATGRTITASIPE